MGKNLFFVFLIASFMVGCSSQKNVRLSEFSLSKGTTWVYSYETYDTSSSDPTQIAKATYQLTESIDDVKTISTYLVAHIQRYFKLITADNGWMDNVSANQPKEFWYVVNNHQVFQSNQALDDTNINIDDLSLAFEFPLSLNKSWCLAPKNSPDAAGCEFVGKRTVINQESYKTQTENFADCYNLIDYYNGGNIFQKFCNGVGVVSMKFDHSGSRFGFEQTLIQYSVGVP
jgi:hypothetical protein